MHNHRYRYSAEFIYTVLSEFEASTSKPREFFDTQEVNSQTVYMWRTKFGKMTEKQIADYRQMEERSSQLRVENQKLQRKLDAVSDFFLREFPDDKIRRGYARRLYQQGPLGQTEACELLIVKRNSFYKCKEQ